MTAKQSMRNDLPQNIQTAEKPLMNLHSFFLTVFREKSFLPHLISLALLSFCVLTTGCMEEQRNSFQGYVEGEYLLVASPLAGDLETLSVSRGQTVAESDPLFSLDQAFEAAAVSEARQGLYRAEKRLADISKGLRPSELAALQARLDQARASLNLSRAEYERRKKLLRQRVVSQEQLDRTRTEMERNAAAVEQLKAELETARLGARTDEIEAARAEVEAARSRVTQAQWSLEQKNRFAPQAGLVYDTFYVEGEFVPAARPVVSILPPEQIKIRFFAPENRLGSLSMGQTVSVRLDGTGKTYQASISYISPQAEYTPPVIYSRETRSKLVFMVEAAVDAADAVTLHPGQPVDVSLEMPNG
jgi:HlyD family secretion protein